MAGHNIIQGSAFTDAVTIRNAGIIPSNLTFADALDTETKCNGNNSLHVVGPSANSNYVGFLINSIANNKPWLDVLIPGRTYTISIYVKAKDTSVMNGGGCIEWRIVKTTSDGKTDWGKIFYPADLKNGEWVRLTRQVYIDKNLKNAYLSFNLVKDGEIWISSPKVEIGTEATDWIPNPADIMDSTKYQFDILARGDISMASVSDGKPGQDGKPGDKGDDGVSVISTTIQYYLSTSKDEMADGTWSADYPHWEPNKWVWIRQETKLSDGTVKYSDGKLWSNLNDLYQLETANREQIIETNKSITSTVEQITKYQSELSDGIKDNKDSIDAFKDEVHGIYATKSEIDQTAQSIQAAIKKTISDNTYKTVASVKLDEAGVHVGTANTQTESVIDGSGLTVKDSDGNDLMKVTTTQSMIQNLKVTEKLSFGAHRVEAIEFEEADGTKTIGTGFFWIGDVK